MRMNSSYPKKIIKYISPRIFITATVYILLFSNVRDIAYLINKTNIGYGNINESVSLLISSIMIMSLTWISYDILVNVASSLGYKEKGGRDFSIIGNTGVINLSEPEKEKRSRNLLEYEINIDKYELNNPLMALGQSRSRIYSHIERLQNSSIVNLFIGVFVAFIGILTIGSTFFEIEKYADKNQGFNAIGFLMFALLPRLSIALIVQVFSFFFLMMYRSNVSDVRYFQNEITNIDSIAAALACLKKDSDPNTKTAIMALLKTERNRLASKNQRIINPSNDEEVMERLSRLEDGLNRKFRQPRNIPGTEN